MPRVIIRKSSISFIRLAGIMAPVFFIFLAPGCGQGTPETDSNNLKDTSRTSVKDTVKKKNPRSDDTTYLFRDFMVICKRDMVCDFVSPGNPPTGLSKGETLYHDFNYIILGDAAKLKGVYRKYKSYIDFPMFPPDSISKAKLSQPDFKSSPLGSNPQFRAAITKGCEGGVNFAGHYTIVEQTEEGGAQTMHVVDRLNGRIYSDMPFRLGKNADGYYGAKYNAGSRMLITNSSLLEEVLGYRLCKDQLQPEIWQWTGETFKRLE